VTLYDCRERALQNAVIEAASDAHYRQAVIRGSRLVELCGEPYQLLTE
jgi:hypothetical protein